MSRIEDRLRRERAVDAAVAVARRLGLEPSWPRVLKDSNNTVIHLRPEPIIAKVSTSVLERLPAGSLSHELDVGLHLAARGAAIAPPTSDPPPGPHRARDLTVTLWELRRHDPTLPVDERQVASALRSVHAALSDYPGDLPPFSAHLEAGRETLESEEATPALPSDDRRFLLEVHARLLDELSSRPGYAHPLHGGPHLDGNVLLTRDGPLLIDFEAACRGPLEWDLSYLPDSVARHFPDADRELLRVLRNATSVCVAAWCWSQLGRAPEVDEAARFHLARLRNVAGSAAS